MVAAVALPAGGRSAEVSTAPLPAQSVETARLEAAALKGVNRVREGRGLPALRRDPELTVMAREFSRQMATRGFFSHTDPEGRTFQERVRAAEISFTSAGENLFKSTGVKEPAAAAVGAWLKSAGHRGNMLNPRFTETGLGVWKRGSSLYFTQEFLGKG
jgi:uncharacterized protein YkwD